MCPLKWLHYLKGVLAVGRVMETPIIHLIEYRSHKLLELSYEKRKTVDIELNEWLEIWEIFLRVGVGEMMRNVNCFVISFGCR